MQIQKVIEQLGYTAKEAKVYLAALSMGEAHVSDIAAKVKLPRTSVQSVVDKLHKDGLMNFYVRKRYKTWEAENPERLLAQLKAREESVREAMSGLQALRTKRGSKAGKPAVRVFTGRDEIKTVFADMLATKHPIDGVLPHDKFLRLFSEDSTLEDFAAARVRNFLRIRLLLPDTPEGRKLLHEGDKKLREVRFLPSYVDIQTVIFIYGNKVANVMFNERQPTAVILEDSGIRDTNSALFEGLWEKSRGKGVASQEELFRLLADRSPQPLLIANDKVEIEYVNKAWEKQFGYSLAEVRSRNPRVLQSEKTPREIYKKMWKTLKAGKTFQSDEIIDKKKDGSFFNLLTTIFPVMAGERQYYVQILDDITEAKRVNEFRKNFVRIAAHGIARRHICFRQRERHPRARAGKAI